MQTYVRTQHDYYVTMVRHGWIMPSYKCAVVTRDFMDGLRQGVFWCPHKNDNISVLLCANPPPKDELLSIWKTAVYDQIAKTEKNKLMDEKYN